MGNPAAPIADPNNNPASGDNNNNSTPAEFRVKDDSLPDDIQGMTASEIVAYYQNKERQLAQRYQEMMNKPPENNSTPSPDPEADTSQFWKDPLNTVKQMAVSREEFNAAAESVQKNLVNVALLTIANNHADWAKWKDKVTQIMQPLPAHLRADPEQWEIAYKYVKGEQYDKDVAAARIEGSNISSEPANEPSTEPIMPEELTAPQSYVARGLGLSEDKFKEGVANLKQDKWPITFDSRNPRR